MAIPNWPGSIIKRLLSNVCQHLNIAHFPNFAPGTDMHTRAVLAGPRWPRYDAAFT